MQQASIFTRQRREIERQERYTRKDRERKRQRETERQKRRIKELDGILGEIYVMNWPVVFQI